MALHTVLANFTARRPGAEEIVYLASLTRIEWDGFVQYRFATRSPLRGREVETFTDLEAAYVAYRARIGEFLS